MNLVSCNDSKCYIDANTWFLEGGHLQWLQQQSGRLNPSAYKDGLETDVTLLVGVKQHKVFAVTFLLASISPVFSKMFSERKKILGLKGSQPMEICVPVQFELAAIEGIVRFSLGLPIKSKTRDIFNMRSAAIYYEINPLREALDRKVGEKMTSKHFFSWVLQKATELEDEALIEKCRDFLQSKVDIYQRTISGSSCSLFNFQKMGFAPDNLELRIGKDHRQISIRFEDWLRLKDKPCEFLEKYNSARKPFKQTKSCPKIKGPKKRKNSKYQTLSDQDTLDVSQDHNDTGLPIAESKSVITPSPALWVNLTEAPVFYSDKNITTSNNVVHLTEAPIFYSDKAIATSNNVLKVQRYVNQQLQQSARKLLYSLFRN